jgi:hypothetical protein
MSRLVRAAAATLAVLALAGCDTTLYCAPCGGALYLVPAGLVAADGPTATSYGVCLGDGCTNVPVPRPRYPGEPVSSLWLTRAHHGDAYDRVTVVAYAGTRVLATARGTNLRVPELGPDTCCAPATLRFDPGTRKLVIGYA